MFPKKRKRTNPVQFSAKFFGNYYKPLKFDKQQEEVSRTIKMEWITCDEN